MSLLGFLKFALNFLDLLGWPLFALGYPLYASIQAIENNSNSETQKLVTYWISFSLVSLFEHSFVNLLQWIQFWPYIKLTIILWLVIPYFDGAFYVYNHLIRPCLLLNPQVIVDEFNKWMVLLWKRDYFLAEVEKHIKGNGPEALEKLIDKEFKTKTPNVDVEEIKAIADVKKKEVEWSHSKEPDIVLKDNKAVEVIEKKEVCSTKQMVLAEPNLEFDHTDNRTSATMEIERPDVAVAAARELPEIPTESEKTLNKCQVTIESEKNKTAYEALEANNWPNIVNFGSFLTVLDSTEKRTYQPIEKPQEATYEVLKAKNQQNNVNFGSLFTVLDSTEKRTYQPIEKPQEATYEALKAKNQQNNVNFGSLFTVLDSTEKRSYQPIEKPQEIESTNGLKWQGQLKSVSSSTAKEYDRPQKQVPKKSVSNIGLKQKIFPTDEKKTQQGWQKNVKKEAIGVKKYTFNYYCNICNVRCTREGDLASHYNGKKHLAQFQAIYGCPTGWM